MTQNQLIIKRKDYKRVKCTQRDYNLGFKLALVSEVEKGNYTYKQIQKVYGIQGRSTVLVWLRKYGTLDWYNPKLQQMSKSKEIPAQKIKRLERELEDEKLRNLLLNTMIDVSDKQFGTDIRKKLSSQQSKSSDKTMS